MTVTEIQAIESGYAYRLEHARITLFQAQAHLAALLAEQPATPTGIASPNPIALEVTKKRGQVVVRVWLIGLLAQLVLATISFSRLAASTASYSITQVPGRDVMISDLTGLLFWSYGLFLPSLPWPRWLKWTGSLASLLVVLLIVYGNLAVWR